MNRKSLGWKAAEGRIEVKANRGEVRKDADGNEERTDKEIIGVSV
jgi:hypothetical protein